MRTDSKVQRWLRPRRQKQPARPARLMKALGASLVGAALITTLTPSPSEAAKLNPWVEVNRIDQNVVVEGHHFPKWAKGIAKLRFSGLKEQKNVNANSGGYFRVTFYNAKPEMSGNAWAGAWINNKIRRTADKYIPAIDNGGNSGGGSVAPTTTTTTAAPPTTKAPTTTTTVRPTTTTTKPGTIPAQSVSSPWKMSFQDDFNGTKVNESNWGIYEGKGNQGIGQRSRSAINVSNGQLHINGRGWVAGGMALRKTQLYGKYEIRSRLDKGQGYNKAELLWPVSERWPKDVEVDISEIFDGNYNEFGSFIHYGSDHQRLHNITKNVDTTQWHTYGVEWTPSKLTFFLDGRAIWTVTDYAAIPHTSHFLGVQLDVSSKSTKTNMGLHVDYVKVWTRA